MIKIIIKLRTTKYTEDKWNKKILKDNNEDFKINEIYSIINKSGSTQIRVKIEHIPCGYIFDKNAYALIALKTKIKCPNCNLKNIYIS